MDPISAPTTHAQNSAQPSALGRALKDRRTSAALTQRALSRAADIPLSTISALESGAASGAEPSTIQALAQALGCSPADLSPTDAPAAATGGADVADVALIPHNRLRPSALNPRKTFDPEALDDLARSLLANGVLMNLLARPDPDNAGGCIIIAGERRWRAAGLNIAQGHWRADHPLPVKIVQADDAEARLLAIVENLIRERVPPLEEAQGIQALLSYDGWDTNRVASSIGKTVRHIQLRLALLSRLDPAVRDALSDDRITLAAARALTAAPQPLQLAMLDRILRGDPSLRRADEIATQIRASVFPARRALFNLDDYVGARATDTVTDEVLLLDVDAARNLQIAAITKIVDSLKERFGWVLVKEHNDFWTPGGGDRIVKADTIMPNEMEPGGLGAVVRVTENLDVAIFENLAMRLVIDRNGDADDDDTHTTPPPQADSQPRPEEDPVEAVSQERRAHAIRAKTRALQAALLDEDNAWLHQLILALLGHHDVCGVVTVIPMPQSVAVAPDVAETLRKFRHQLGDDVFQPMTGAWPYLSLRHEGQDYAQSSTGPALRLLPRLQALTTQEATRLLAALTASRCFIRWLPGRANLGDDPLVLATAATIGANVDQIDSPIDDDYLHTLTLDQLERLANDIGAADDSFPTLNRPKRHRLILAHIMANDIRYVPPEMCFGDRAEIEAKLHTHHALSATEGGR